MVSLVMAPPSSVSEQPSEPALTVGDFSIEMSDTGVELVTMLILLRRDEVGQMFPEAEGADLDGIGEEEPAAMLMLYEDDELVVEFSRISHGAPPRPCGG
jgi:hypothetical protein